MVILLKRWIPAESRDFYDNSISHSNLVYDCVWVAFKFLRLKCLFCEMFKLLFNLIYGFITKKYVLQLLNEIVIFISSFFSLYMWKVEIMQLCFTPTYLLSRLQKRVSFTNEKLSCLLWNVSMQYFDGAFFLLSCFIF